VTSTKKTAATCVYLGGDVTDRYANSRRCDGCVRTGDLRQQAHSALLAVVVAVERFDRRDRSLAEDFGCETCSSLVRIRVRLDERHRVQARSRLGDEPAFIHAYARLTAAIVTQGSPGPVGQHKGRKASQMPLR